MKVLTNCIANLTNFQDNIIQLRRFFNGIYRYTEDIDRTVVADFLDSANQLSAADPSTKEECQERTKYCLEVSVAISDIPDSPPMQTLLTTIL